MGFFFFFFLDKCLIVFPVMCTSRGRHDDGFSADGVFCTANRGADWAGKMPDETWGQPLTCCITFTEDCILTYYRLKLYMNSMFLFVQTIYMNLLTLSFTSLSWKDTTNCHRTASMVCWTLLRQVAHSMQQMFNRGLDFYFFYFFLSFHVTFLGDYAGGILYFCCCP